MSIYLGGQEYDGIYVAGAEVDKIQARGIEYHDASPAPPIARPRHTFSILCGSSGTTVGLNITFGRIAAGSANYTTPAGRSVTVRMCRRLNNVLVFAIGGGGLDASHVADFPSRIISKLRTDPSVIVEVSRPASLRSVGGGNFRGD